MSPFFTMLVVHFNDIEGVTIHLRYHRNYEFDTSIGHFLLFYIIIIFYIIFLYSYIPLGRALIH